ncbi:GNAT family N-acetyltransferase [Microbacterium sp. SCN 69-37]|uniref:GNAT family N-acetyltransferase n=1 Tax=Microbacterium sp. SCN 69-37 TaxID=1660115 RepID=UPI000A8F8514|nr:GNAT family N-acetyltransferase [Microbacterium sp. SCN 69-37]
MSDVTIRPIRVPPSMDAPEIADLEALRELRNAHGRQVHGSSAYDMTLPQVLAAWQDQADRAVIGRLAERNGLIVGTVGVDYLPDAQSRNAGVMVRVREEHRRRGIGTRLLREAEGIAADLGRSVLQAWTEHRHPGGASVGASTGFGAVDTCRDRQRRGESADERDERGHRLHSGLFCRRVAEAPQLKRWQRGQ